MFVAAILAAGLVAGSLSTVAGELSQGMQARGDALHDELAGRFVIANDPGNVPQQPFTAYVKNTGSVDLVASQFVLIVDGQAAGFVFTNVTGTPVEVVQPGELMSIQTNKWWNLAAGSHTMTIIAGNGHKESLQFTV